MWTRDICVSFVNGPAHVMTPLFAIVIVYQCYAAMRRRRRPEKPLVSAKYPVLWKFDVDVPEKYLRLKPDWIDDGYFLSALYSLEGIKKLAGLVPEKAGSGNESFSAGSLLRRLDSIKKSA